MHAASRILFPRRLTSSLKRACRQQAETMHHHYLRQKPGRSHRAICCRCARQLQPSSINPLLWLSSPRPNQLLAKAHSQTNCELHPHPRMQIPLFVRGCLKLCASARCGIKCGWDYQSSSHAHHVLLTLQSRSIIDSQDAS